MLGSMLISQGRDRRRARGRPRASDFYRPAHETIFDAITDLYAPRRAGRPGHGRRRAAAARGAAADRRRAVPAHAAARACRSPPTPATTPSIVREKSILRRLVDAGTKIAQLGYAGEGQVDDTVDRAQAEIYSITEKRPRRTTRRSATSWRRTLDEIEAISNHDGTLRGVPTGLTDLDELTNGLQSGQMIIVAGRPGSGKSTLGPGLLPGRVDPQQHDQRDLQPGDVPLRRSPCGCSRPRRRIPLNHMRNGPMSDDDWAQARPQDGRGVRGADVHRRLPEHDDDGDPGEGPPAQAAPRPAS